MVNIKRLIKSIQDNNKLSVSSNSLILGNKGQSYDKEAAQYGARKDFSFQVQVSRIAEISRMSLGSPLIDDIYNHAIPKWYIGKKSPDTYTRLIDGYINTGERWNLINQKGSSIVKNWDSELKILDVSGSYLQSVYSQRMDDSLSKQFQAQSLGIMTEIQSVTSKLNEIDFNKLGLSDQEGRETISKLQIYGILYVAPNEIIVPSIAQEIHGEKIDDVLNDVLSDPLNRLIYDLIKKMPGLSFKKLLTFIPIDLSDELKRIRIRSVINDCIGTSLIFTIISDYGDDFYLIPSWLCHSLFQKLNPTIISTFQLKMCFVVCSNYWDKITDLSDIDENIQKIRILLHLVRKNQEISHKEYDEMPPAQRIFLSNLRKIGTLKSTLTGIRVDGVNHHILETLLLILTASYRSEMETQNVRRVDFSEAQIEMGSSIQEVMAIISDRLSLTDFKQIQGLS